MYETVKFIKDGPVAKVYLNRPEVHNAFNEKMIKELIQVFQKIQKNKDLRAVILTGKGKSFCAGADLKWMKEVVNYSFEENLKESRNLSELYYSIYTLDKPVIGKINGPAIGGGFGLVTVCDIIVASEKSFFKLSEVKVGLVPAVISPYLIKKFGENIMREMFLLGNKFTAERAYELKMVHRLATPENIDNETEKIIKEILLNSPEAVKVSKELLFNVPLMNFYECQKYTIDTIAKKRISPDGQEGMKSFLEKGKPSWQS